MLEGIVKARKSIYRSKLVRYCNIPVITQTILTWKCHRYFTNFGCAINNISFPLYWEYKKLLIFPQQRADKTHKKSISIFKTIQIALLECSCELRAEVRRVHRLEWVPLWRLCGPDVWGRVLRGHWEWRHGRERVRLWALLRRLWLCLHSTWVMCATTQCVLSWMWEMYMLLHVLSQLNDRAWWRSLNLSNSWRLLDIWPKM